MRIVESETAGSQQYGMSVMFMHLSSLKPTSRRTHAERHGHLYSASEVREFWAVAENRFGCTCSISAVVVDSAGEPLVNVARDRARKTYEKMKARHGSDWV